MRFRFCGDLDCPDWVLAEIHTLSKMSSVKMKHLCDHVATALCGQNLEEGKIDKLVTDAKLESGSMQACVSVVCRLLTSAARFSVFGDVLCSELEQLGLPAEHASAITRVYSKYSEKIASCLAKGVLRLHGLGKVQCNAVGDKRAELRLNISNLDQSVEKSIISMTADQVILILADMKAAQKEIELESSASCPKFDT